MASEAFVDLSYRGLVLGKRVRLLQVGPRSAYVAHDAPMPVGTELILTVDEGVSIRAEVARVREGDSKDGPAGMWLWADPAEQRARAWWDEHVSADDPRIPEPGGGRIRVEAPVAAAPAPESPAASRDLDVAEQAGHAVDTAAAMPSDPQPDHGPHEHTGEHDGEPRDEHTGEHDDYAIEIGRAATSAGREHDRAETGDLDEEALELPRGNTPGRPARGTQIMTAVEIADVLGQPAVLDGEAQLDAAELAGRERDIRTTHVMSAVDVADVLASGGDGEPAPTDDGSAKGKARKRRGRKRR